MAHPLQADFDRLADKVYAVDFKVNALTSYAEDAAMPERSFGWFKDHAAEFDWIDGKLVHVASMKDAAPWIATDLRNQAGYLWPQPSDREALRRAFIAGDLTEKGRLYQSLGPVEYERVKAIWKDGEPEQHAVIKAETDREIQELEARLKTLRSSQPAPVVAGGNPWAEKTWNPARQLVLARQDAKAAAAMAEAVGSFLGSPRPGAVRLTPRRS